MLIENIFYPLLSFIPALINVGIIIYIIFFLPRGKTTAIFTFFVLALVCWQSEDTIVRICATEDTARFWDSILCIGWIGLAPLALHFACRYASIQFRYNRLSLIAIYLPFILFYVIYHAIQQPTIFIYNKGWGWVNTPRPDTLDGIQRYFISVFVIAALVILFRHAYQIRKNREKRIQAFLIATGMLLPALQGIITQVVFPVMLSIQEIPVTSSGMTLFSLATIVALSRYQLFNISDSVAVETLLENFKNIVLIISPDEKIIYQNLFSKQLFAKNDQALPDTALKDMFPSTGDYDEFIKEVIEPSLMGQPAKNFSTQLQVTPTKKMDVLVTAERIINNNRLQGIMLVMNDITDRLKTLNKLKRSNDRYNLVSMATNDMVWDWNLETGKIYRNREGWRKLFKSPLVHNIGNEESWNAKIYPEDVVKVQRIKEQIFGECNKDFFEVEYRMVRSDGSIAYVHDRGYMIRNKAGNPVRLIGATQDITRRKETENMLREEQLRKQKEITDAVILAQEKERQSIGAELHDNVNQILASSLLYLGLVRDDEENRNLYFQNTQQYINDAIQEIRKLSHALVAPSLNGIILTEVFNELVELAELSEVFRVEKHIAIHDELQISESLKLTIYRIVQEQFNNIMKHASATKVVLRLVQNTDGGIILSIEDDGVGFDVSQKARGVGLMNMQTRASIYNGNLKLTSAPNKGCTLQVEFPKFKTEPLLQVEGV